MLPHFHGNKLTCYSIANASNREKALRSETEMVIIHGSSRSQGVSICLSSMRARWQLCSHCLVLQKLWASKLWPMDVIIGCRYGWHFPQRKHYMYCSICSTSMAEKIFQNRRNWWVCPRDRNASASCLGFSPTVSNHCLSPALLWWMSLCSSPVTTQNLPSVDCTQSIHEVSDSTQ